MFTPYWPGLTFRFVPPISPSRFRLDRMPSIPVRPKTCPKACPSCCGADWKQTVFYIGDALAVDVSFFDGQPDLDQFQFRRVTRLKATLAWQPNARNNRDLDIVIDYAVDNALGHSGERREYKMYVSKPAPKFPSHG